MALAKARQFVDSVSRAGREHEPRNKNRAVNHLCRRDVALAGCCSDSDEAGGLQSQRTCCVVAGCSLLYRQLNQRPDLYRC